MNVVTNIVRSLLDVVLQLVISLLSAVSGLLNGVTSSISNISNSLVLYFYLIPSVDKILSDTQRLYPALKGFYKNATFEHEYYVFYRDVLRANASLYNGPTPVTNDFIASQTAALQVLQQENNEVNSDASIAFATNCASTCSNVSIQLINCSCYQTAEVGQFLNDYVLVFGALTDKIFEFFIAAVNQGQDFDEDILSPGTTAARVKIHQDAQTLYNYIYQNNGIVNDTQVAADFSQLSSDINNLASTFSAAVDSQSYTGEAL